MVSKITTHRQREVKQEHTNPYKKATRSKIHKSTKNRTKTNTKHILMQRFLCPNCQSTAYNIETIRVAGSKLSSIFGIETTGFTVVSCNDCGFSHLYIKKISLLTKIIDFFVG